MASSYLILGASPHGPLAGESASVDPPQGAIEILKLSHTIEWEDKAERDAADQDLADSLILDDARGQARHKAIKITKHIDSSSPALREHCNLHKVIPKVTIHVFANNSPGPNPVINRQIFKIYLDQVTVDQVDLDIDGDEIPEESIELRYKKIAWIYQSPVVEAPTAAAGGSRFAGWDTAHEDEVKRIAPTMGEAKGGTGAPPAKRAPPTPSTKANPAASPPSTSKSDAGSAPVKMVGTGAKDA